MPKKYHEMQGEEFKPEIQEDEVYLRNAEGEFVKVEVPDDVENN